MIRRISANNDYRDIVRSCPSGVIDDIYAIEYYVKGYDGVYSAAFSKTGSLLEVILPSSALQTFHSGMLMRRAKYRNADSSFPDQYYDLEFVEDMDVWLENDGVEPGPGPGPGEYVTEEELAETLEDYVTDEEFSVAQRAIGALNTSIENVVSSLSDYATKQFVGQAVDYVEGEIQGVASNLNSIDTRVTALEQSTGGVTQEQFAAHVASNNESFRILQMDTGDNSQRIEALENAGFATSQDLDDAITNVQDQIDDTDLIVGDLSDSVSDLDQRVTDLEQGGGGGGSSWGNITGDITDQQDLMIEFEVDRSRLDDLENGTVVPTGTATESWVQQQGYLTQHQDLTGYATQSWVQSQGYLTSHQDLTGYLHFDENSPLPYNTLPYYGFKLGLLPVVQGDGKIKNIEVMGNNTGWMKMAITNYDSNGNGLGGTDFFVTESWVNGQGYATQSWVQSQGYLTSHQDLTGYATQSWATSQFLEESKVWTGTSYQWSQLTSAQKAFYTIALIIE